MRLNLPVHDEEYEFPPHVTLLSTTDVHSHLTYANGAFVQVSGFERDELLGQPHNVVRHPDMPREAFADMWRTLSGGDSWTALVKNRRKDGRFYWVRANATPVLRDGRVSGYMSVRTQPTRDEVAASERLYAALRAATAGRIAFCKGVVVRTGLLRWASALRTMPVCWRLRAAVAGVAAGSLGTAALAGLPLLPWAGLAAATLLLALLAAAWLEWQIVQPLRRVLAQAGAVAAGMPGENRYLDRIDEIGMILRSVNQAGLNMRSLVDDVGQQVAGVRQASADITRGNEELRSRTEQASASLQETAASLEQLAATVRANAERASEVTGLAATASQAVAQGGAAVGDVVRKMGEITQASRRIADIVGVIDTIAFQTNILALNAAVEAARAGENGRGFAVVAGEVRTLAQRSANAAREIKQLIGGSVETVEAGAAVADAARTSMEHIVAGFGGVAALLAGITTATQEQAGGIAAINIAVSRFDEVTQRNAALVEQSALAAQGLQRRAEQLGAALAVFQPSQPAGRGHGDGASSSSGTSL